MVSSGGTCPGCIFGIKDPATLGIYLHTLGSECRHLEGVWGWARLAACPLPFMSPGA